MLNELRERGSLCSLLQRPGLTGREGGKNTEHRQTITIFHLVCQGENGHEADTHTKTRGLLHLLEKNNKALSNIASIKIIVIIYRPFFCRGTSSIFMSVITHWTMGE